MCASAVERGSMHCLHDLLAARAYAHQLIDDREVCYAVWVHDQDLLPCATHVQY